jgi:hypothetical protein
MTTGVVDTDGKLDAFINNTSGQLTAGVVDAGEASWAATVVYSCMVQRQSVRLSSDPILDA